MKLISLLFSSFPFNRVFRPQWNSLASTNTHKQTKHQPWKVELHRVWVIHKQVNALLWFRKLILLSEIVWFWMQTKMGNRKKFSVSHKFLIKFEVCINFINSKGNEKIKAHPIFMELEWIALKAGERERDENIRCWNWSDKNRTIQSNSDREKACIAQIVAYIWEEKQLKCKQ